MIIVILLVFGHRSSCLYLLCIPTILRFVHCQSILLIAMTIGKLFYTVWNYTNYTSSDSILNGYDLVDFITKMVFLVDVWVIYFLLTPVNFMSHILVIWNCNSIIKLETSFCCSVAIMATIYFTITNTTFIFLIKAMPVKLLVAKMERNKQAKAEAQVKMENKKHIKIQMIKWWSYRGNFC